VREREPGTTEFGFEYSRETIRDPGGEIDRAVFRASDRAFKRVGKEAPTHFVALNISPATLWHFRAGMDSPLGAALEQLGGMPGREALDEVLLVTPARPGTMPPEWPRLRGAGVLLERPERAASAAGAAPAQSPSDAWPWNGLARPFAFVAIWRVDARTLRVLGRVSSFEEGSPSPATRQSGRHTAPSLMEALVKVVEQTVEAAAVESLTARPATADAASTSLPRAEIKADRMACRDLTFQWLDAMTREREWARVAGADLELRKAAAERNRIYQRRLALGCTNTDQGCGKDDARRKQFVDDLDRHEEIAARGVGDGYYLSFFNHPDTLACRELQRARAQERASDKPR
jgi:hypothetical protein